MNHNRAASWRGQISRWGPAVLMMAVIFTASSFPSRDLPNFRLWDRLVKKGGHMLGYALLAMATAHGLASGARPTRRQLLMAVVLAGLYGVTDEFHQWFVAGRGAAAADVLIDAAGATVGAWSLSLWLRGRRTNPNSQL